MMLVWFEFLDSEGKAIDNHFEFRKTFEEAKDCVWATTRWPFQYQISQDGLVLVNWTLLKESEDV